MRGNRHRAVFEQRSVVAQVGQRRIDVDQLDDAIARAVDVPIVAYQFNPLIQGAASSDASLLYPVTTWDTLNRAVHWGGGYGRGYLTVVAGFDGEQVGRREPVDQPRDARLNAGPSTHGTGFQGHVELAARQAVVADVAADRVPHAVEHFRAAGEMHAGKFFMTKTYFTNRGAIYIN